ncbi:MAG: aminotransferase class I/II-fold pyridoxal phosphate-dependent enzyme [Ruminococcus sp.]|jgi:histidinol-phosphate aminotransferase|nr:aminotransferase class I/II-fold pyridoxal phosphate-dependent enzyme [Ruminococcus sp.]
MYELTKKLKKIDSYEPVELDFKIRLDANESPLNVTPEMAEEIGEAVKKIPFNRYPDPYACKVRQAFADRFNLPIEYITAGNGSDELISIIASCFLEKGDRILTLTPDFSMYAFYSKLYELDVRILQKDEAYNTINVSEIIEYCNVNNIKAVIFSNPCNPTSLGIKKSEIIRLLKNVFCLVIIDEAYMDFWDESVLDEVQNFDNLIVLKTCSKAYGAAAIRLGFAVAKEEISKALRAAKSPYNTDTLSQVIGEIILRHSDIADRNIKTITENKEYLQSGLEKLSEDFGVIDKVFDSVTNFVLIRTIKGREIYEALLEKSISVRYMGKFLRITAGTKAEIDTLLTELRVILEDLN